MKKWLIIGLMVWGWSGYLWYAINDVKKPLPLPFSTPIEQQIDYAIKNVSGDIFRRKKGLDGVNDVVAFGERALFPLIKAFEKEPKDSKKRLMLLSCIGYLGRNDSAEAIDYLVNLLIKSDDYTHALPVLEISGLRNTETLLTLRRTMTNPPAERDFYITIVLEELTKQKLGISWDTPEKEKAIKKFDEYISENKDYLYWSINKWCFLIDQEAKKAGIPTDEYRKTHPWLEED